MVGPTFHISDKTYAASIKRDREANQAAKATSQECFTCGRSFITGDGRFCSTQCRDGFDVGLQQQQTRNTQKRIPHVIFNGEG